jgi:hypothetical protein
VRGSRHHPPGATCVESAPRYDLFSAFPCLLIALQRITSGAALSTCQWPTFQVLRDICYCLLPRSSATPARRRPREPHALIHHLANHDLRLRPARRASPPQANPSQRNDFERLGTGLGHPPSASGTHTTGSKNQDSAARAAQGHALLGEDSHQRKTALVSASCEQGSGTRISSGTTGTGKSTRLVNLITPFPRRGAVGILDPDGDRGRDTRTRARDAVG